MSPTAALGGLRIQGLKYCSTYVLPTLEHKDVDAVRADGRLVQAPTTNDELIDLRIVHSVVGILHAVREHLPH